MGKTKKKVKKMKRFREEKGTWNKVDTGRADMQQEES